VKYGLELWSDCYYNNISNNEIYWNEIHGIHFHTRANNNTISNNRIYSNGGNGFLLWNDCDNNTFTENLIYSNTNYGASIGESSCENNSVWFNYFNGNGGSFNDAATDNNWDNGTIGNYWAEYSGIDLLPFDGIGDTPYIGVGNAVDNYPIMNNHHADDDYDGDSFKDLDEIGFGTNAFNASWYPMPNLYVSDYNNISTYNETTFQIAFTIRNNGIWKAEGVVITVRCDALNLTLFNNTDTPINLDVDDSAFISFISSPISTLGTYIVDVVLDPNDLINEDYSAKDGSLRANAENDNSQQINLTVEAFPIDESTVPDDPIPPTTPAPTDYTPVMIGLIVGAIIVGASIIIIGLLAMNKNQVSSKLRPKRDVELKKITDSKSTKK